MSTIQTSSVYVLTITIPAATHDSWDKVIGVFSTRQKAEQFWEKTQEAGIEYEDSNIEEFMVDPII